MSGVSVDLFCAVEQHLRGRYGRGVDVCIDAETMNRWIVDLAKIEDEYRAKADAARNALTGEKGS